MSQSRAPKSKLLGRWLASLLRCPRRRRKPRLDILTLEERTVPDGSSPVLANVRLLHDTGASDTDRVTYDPTVTGDVTNDDGLELVTVEYDADADGAADGEEFVRPNGTFL